MTLESQGFFSVRNNSFKYNILYVSALWIFNIKLVQRQRKKKINIQIPLLEEAEERRARKRL